MKNESSMQANVVQGSFFSLLSLKQQRRRRNKVNASTGDGHQRAKIKHDKPRLVKLGQHSRAFRWYEEEDSQGKHGKCCFDFSLETHFDSIALSALRHPFSQCRYSDLSRKNDGGGDGDFCAMSPRKKNQGRADHQFVSHWVQERPEGACDIPSTSQVSVQPISIGGDREERTG
mmetsp:Transcript_98567/g.147754  ORF Transcript_98567/g.147754 Transcript_98567/m.147754 type:complete len:174 (-) Transcript_98567:197-718(-)